MAEGLLGGILGGEDEEKTASTKAGPGGVRGGGGR
jgi:hypothetical protein